MIPQPRCIIYASMNWDTCLCSLCYSPPHNTSIRRTVRHLLVELINISDWLPVTMVRYSGVWSILEREAPCPMGRYVCTVHYVHTYKGDPAVRGDLGKPVRCGVNDDG